MNLQHESMLRQCLPQAKPTAGQTSGRTCLFSWAAMRRFSRSCGVSFAGA